jgi:putative toxin-antitoxin system antitoxin component (TIGR02293 family)
MASDTAAEGLEIERAAALVGGARVLRHPVATAFDVHAALSEGLPGEAVTQLMRHVPGIAGDDFEAAIGMSLRTVQRLKQAPRKRLSRMQSGQVWNFARIVAKATTVLGTPEAAEQWLERPALGLDGRRPIELLASTAGVGLVEEFLERLEHGVYV